MMIFPTEWKKMFHTTNQFCAKVYLYTHKPHRLKRGLSSDRSNPYSDGVTSHPREYLGITGVKMPNIETQAEVYETQRNELGNSA